MFLTINFKQMCLLIISKLHLIIYYFKYENLAIWSNLHKSIKIIAKTDEW